MPSQAANVPHIHSGAMTEALAQLHTEGRALPAVKVLDRGPISDVMSASPGTLVSYRRGEKADQEGDYWNKQFSQEQFDGGRRFVAEAGNLPAGILFEVWNEQDAGQGSIEQAKRLNKATMGAIFECQQRGYRPLTGNWSTGTPSLSVMGQYIDSVTATANARGRVGIHPYTTREPFRPDQIEILLLRWPRLLLPALWDAGMPRTVRPVAWGSEFGVDYIWQYPLSSAPWKIQVDRGWYTVESMVALYAQMGDALRREGFEYLFMYDFYAPGGDVVGSDQEIYDWARGRWKDQSLALWMSYWRNHISPALVIPGENTPPSSGRATVTSTLGLRVRPEPNSPVVMGTLPFNSVVDVISSDNGWSKMEIRAGNVVLIAGASDQNPYGFVASEWLRFG